MGLVTRLNVVLRGGEVAAQGFRAPPEERRDGLHLDSDQVERDVAHPTNVESPPAPVSVDVAQEREVSRAEVELADSAPDHEARLEQRRCLHPSTERRVHTPLRFRAPRPIPFSIQ